MDWVDKFNSSNHSNLQQKSFVIETERGPIFEWQTKNEVLDPKGCITVSKEEAQDLYKNLKGFFG